MCFLLDKGADIDARNNDQMTPLHLACCFSHTAVAYTLINRGARVTCACNVQCVIQMHGCVYVCVRTGVCVCCDVSCAHLCKPVSSCVDLLFTLFYLYVLIRASTYIRSYSGSKRQCPSPDALSTQLR